MSSHKSLINKRRTAYTLSTLSVSLVLFMIGTILYLIMNAAKATNSIMDNMKVVVILKNDTPDKRVEEICNLAKKGLLVTKCEYISRGKAEEMFKAYIGEDFSLKLGNNPLPASIDMHINPKLDTKESVKKLKTILKGVNEVDEVLYQESMMESVSSNISNFKIVLLVFSVVLLFISFIMIDNTIKMAVLSKRFLIKTMLLIGAKKGFIRRPFLLKAVLQSFWSTLIASFMLGGLIVGLKRSIPELEIIFENYQVLLIIPLTMFAIGVVVCLLSTLSAVNRYMKLKENDLYTY